MDPCSQNVKDEAARAFDSILIAQPENFYAIYRKALTFFNDGKLRECLEVIDEAIKLQSKGVSGPVILLKETVEKLVSLFDRKALCPAEPPVASKAKFFMCSACGNSFGTNFNLKRHMIQHTGNRPWKCKDCGRSFIQKIDLERHLTVHSDKKNFGCSICNKFFKTKKNLSSHSQVHSTEGPRFTCSVCAKQFKMMRLLRSHMRIHAEVKPFSCGVCDKGFVGKANLASHMLVHQIERPFACIYCDTTFKRKHDMNFHIVHRHPSGAGRKMAY